MLYPHHTPGKIAGFIQTYAFCQHIYCSVTQFRQKKAKKTPWEHLPRFALSPLCYQVCPSIALPLSIIGSRCWVTQWHLSSLTCLLAPCSLAPSTCCQNRAAWFGIQFYHLCPWHECSSPQESGIYKAWLLFKRPHKYPRKWQMLKEGKGKYVGNFLCMSRIILELGV